MQATMATQPAVLLLFLAVLLAGAATFARGFYLPGVAPADFRRKDPLAVKVSQLSSTKTQLPYSYYSLPFCRPDAIVDSAENLGELLRGDRIENTPYVFEMREPRMCQIVCKTSFTQEGAKDVKEKIDDDYRINMILDNLPLVVPIKRMDKDAPTVYQHGVHVGIKGQYSGSKEEKHFIHNHLTFLVKYHRDAETDFARIVAFEVKPFSVKHEYDGDWKGNATRLKTCDPHSRQLVLDSDSPQEVEANKDIIFSYDVNFEESDIKWSSRWDSYLLMTDDQIHWFSIVNSLMIVLFLSGMVAMIMLRTLYRDITKYNQLDVEEDAQEETGWKLVHGDVFRPPANAELLCVYVGTGVQFFGMLLVTLLFAILGLLSPSNRGGLMTAMLLAWVFMGLLAGYSSARLYKVFKGSEWKKVTIKTATMFPGIVFAIFFVLNALIWGERSSGAVPFTTMTALVLLWFGISVPLVFVGSYHGFKKQHPAMEDPVRTNKIPRPIPAQPWYMHPAVLVPIGGVLPFGAVFIELFFILTSIWLHQFYYIFGFLFLVFVILVLTCAEITVVLCYFQLCGEDYRWWWRSYLTAGSSAVYLFLYAGFYFFTKLDITRAVSGLLYFGYMLIASYAFFVLTGTVGFCACFWFTRLIYSSVKID
ncbi:transmembrane 9 superfamily member 10 [Lolium perenne]|uniref:transmembrane 9 superfamily member 10 n=1 Tax=Lolium perenne TaxID=4522 RepID=UPI0021EB4617|nr:transmembrane 9 superfamily member 10-like isoform X1 [Lolium perenne]